MKCPEAAAFLFLQLQNLNCKVAFIGANVKIPAKKVHSRNRTLRVLLK